MRRGEGQAGGRRLETGGKASRGPARAAAAVLVALTAATARAHDTGGVLDLEPLEDLVRARIGGSTGRARSAYLAIRRALERRREGVAGDLAKLDVAARQCRTRLASDDALRALVATGLDDAAAFLAGEPADLAALATLLERAKDRARVLRLRAAGEAQFDAASAAATEPRRVRGLRGAAARFDAAFDLGSALVARQSRRAAPGQPVPRGASGTIATYAGTGAQGAGAEGAPARATPFYFPYDVATDPSTGRVLVVDSNTHRIRRIDDDGRVRTVAGSGRLGDSVGTARESDLHHPSSVAFDPATGDLLICGWHAARLLRLGAATGTIAYAGGSGVLGFSGDGGPAVDAEFDYPSNVVFLRDGTWFVADAGNLRIRRVDPATGEIETFAGSGARGAPGAIGESVPALAAVFEFPPGEDEGPVGRIAVDPAERWMYVADTANHVIRRIDLADADHPVTVYAGDGVAAWAGDGLGRLAASFVAPVDVECDGEGHVFVCDRGSSTVRRIDAETGVVTTIAGTGAPGYSGDGGPATSAQLDHPQGIHVDRVRGRVYVADTLNSVARVVWE